MPKTRTNKGREGKKKNFKMKMAHKVKFLREGIMNEYKARYEVLKKSAEKAIESHNDSSFIRSIFDGSRGEV